MQVELPDDVLRRAALLAGEGEDAAAVIAKAIERLEWETAEVAAVQEGIDAYQRGEHEPWEDFARRFRDENGISYK